MSPINVLIVNKDATLTPYKIKEFNEEKLFKKCGFKSSNGFDCFSTWSIRLSGQKYFVRLYGKNTGKTTSENKYEFPPPADNILLFGNAILVAFTKHKETDELCATDLTQEHWLQVENKLFGGLDDLSNTAEDDENEEDELDNIPSSLKTKQGYLKDNFVVSSSEEDEINEKVPKKKNPSNKDTKGKKKSSKNREEPQAKKEILLCEEEYDY